MPSSLIQRHKTIQDVQESFKFHFSLVIHRTESKHYQAMHYRISLLCRVPKALGKDYYALSKSFAECGTQQRTLGKILVSKAGFAECPFSGTRQNLCRVPKMHSAKKSDRDGGRPLTAASPSAKW